MRFLVILVLLSIAGYVGYSWFGSDPTPDAGIDSSSADSDSAPNGDNQREGRIDEQVPVAPPAPGQEDELRSRLAKSQGLVGDQIRMQLAQLLLGKKDGAAAREADALLQAVYERGGGLSPQAAALLLRRPGTANGAETRLEYARFLVEKGETAPGYARSCFELGRAQLGRTEDSAQVEAWEYLSKAYFATLDESWRAQIRPDLQKLVDTMLLSPRVTKAATLYAVKSGDSLARIASSHGTTVEALKWLNGIETDVIHPRQTFKVLTGVFTVEVDKSEFRLDLRLDGKFLYSAPVGLGQHGKTPLGDFKIEIRQKHPTWYPPGLPEVSHGDPENPLGDYWLGFEDTETYSGYGIHGTDDNTSIGKESSKGCVRMRNEQVEVLFRLLPAGTKVTIRE